VHVSTHFVHLGTKTIVASPLHPNLRLMHVVVWCCLSAVHRKTLVPSLSPHATPDCYGQLQIDLKLENHSFSSVLNKLPAETAGQMVSRWRSQNQCCSCTLQSPEVLIVGMLHNNLCSCCPVNGVPRKLKHAGLFTARLWLMAILPPCS
jgi:hypothetical protein